MCKLHFNIIILTGSTGSQVPLVEEIPKYWFKLLISSFPSFPEELSEYSGFMCSAGLCGLIMRRRETPIPNLSSVRFLVLNTALCLSFLAMIQGLKDGFSWSLQLYSEQRPQWIIHYRLWERVRMKFTFSVELFILGPSPAGVHWLGFFVTPLYYKFLNEKGQHAISEIILVYSLEEKLGGFERLCKHSARKFIENWEKGHQLISPFDWSCNTESKTALSHIIYFSYC